MMDPNSNNLPLQLSSTINSAASNRLIRNDDLTCERRVNSETLPPNHLTSVRSRMSGSSSTIPSQVSNHPDPVWLPNHFNNSYSVHTPSVNQFNPWVGTLDFNHGPSTAVNRANGNGQFLPLSSRPRPKYPRKPLGNCPLYGQICHLPCGSYFPDSIIHRQKRHQEGFWNHPVLIVGLEENHVVHFYALTKNLPSAIADLNMFFWIGFSSRDENESTLKLAPGSSAMRWRSLVNLEQRYSIEWGNLDTFKAKIYIDRVDLEKKVPPRVAALEAAQNRYIYKPLPRNLGNLGPGTIVMLRNTQRNASTLGAPVLIFENRSHYFSFFRVKEFQQNPNFSRTAKHATGTRPEYCLEICASWKPGHDRTCVLLVETGSPLMRARSYVDVSDLSLGNFEECATWCWPPVVISEGSLRYLRWYAQSGVCPPAAGFPPAPTSPSHDPSLNRYAPYYTPGGYGIRASPHYPYPRSAYQSAAAALPPETMAPSLYATPRHAAPNAAACMQSSGLSGSYVPLRDTGKMRLEQLGGSGRVEEVEEKEVEKWDGAAPEAQGEGRG